MRKKFYLAAVLSILAVFPATARASDAFFKTTFDAVLEAASETAAAMKENEASEPDKISVTMSFAGDCTLGTDSKFARAGGFFDYFENQTEPYKYFLSNVESIFENDDLTIVNLEGPLTNVGTKAVKEFAFRGPPEFTGILTEGSVEIVNLANNHTYDYGEAGYQNTIKNLNEAGIASFGVDKSYIAEINGVKIGFLGYKGWSADAGIKNKITGDIKSLRESGAKAVVVTFHGGEEAVYYPNNVQKTLYRHACDSGADLVVASHPHVLQGIELYNGKYIAYSLGNFCFGGNRNPTDKDTVIFRQTFEFNPTTLDKTGESAEIVPCSVSSVSNRNNFQPTPLTGASAQRVIDKINRLSLELNNNKSILDYIDIYTGD